MKKQTIQSIVFLLCGMLAVITSHAQAPQAFPYQAVAHDSVGNLIADENISLRFSILDGSNAGPVVYQETQSVTTTSLGLFNLNIGQGTVISGAFSNINWGSGTKYLQVEMDASGGTNYLLMGTSQLLSVPYAIYSNSAGSSSGAGLADGTAEGNTPYWDGTSWVTSSSNIYNNGSKVGIGVSTPEFKLHVSDDASFNNVRVGTGNGSSNVKTNTAIGFEVLKNNTVGNYNTAGGYYSLSNNTSGNFNTAFGDYTLFNNSTGNANTAVGNYSLFSNTGFNNTAMGNYALFSNTTGGSNTAVGNYSMFSNTTGSNNTVIGYQADLLSPDLINATAIGANTIVNSSNALILGNNANVGIGTSEPTFKLEVTADASINSVKVGRGGGNLDQNTVVGTLALDSNTTGLLNTAIGYHALLSNSTGNFNTAVGWSTLFSNTTGNANTAIGENALPYNTTGSNNAALGNNAAQTNTTGSNNTAIGSKALSVNSTGSDNVAIGREAALNNTNDAITAIGSQALMTNTTGLFNTAIGYQSLFSNTTGNLNTAIGYQSLFSNTTGNYNTAVGWSTLFSNTTGSGNTAMGEAALIYNTTGSNNAALGNNAAQSNTTGSSNTAIGSQALVANTTGALNTAIGYQSLFSNTSGSENVAIGKDAGQSNTTGSQNTAIGVSALSENSTGSVNTAIGWYAMQRNTVGAANTALGEYALSNNTTGLTNVAIGANALSANTTGSDNIALGKSANVGSGNLSNAIAIGTDAIVNTSNSMVLGNGVNVGIGTSSPAYDLHIKSSSAELFKKPFYVEQADNDFPLFLLSDNPSNNGFVLYDKFGNASAVFNTGNDSYFNTSGFFGIGTTAPQAELDVAGDAIIGGKLTVNTGNTDQVKIVSTNSTTNQSSSGSYPLYISGAKAGILIRVTETDPGLANNFITFWDDNPSAVGAIEGQTVDEVHNSWTYIFWQAAQSLQLALSVAAIAADGFGADDFDMAIIDGLEIVDIGVNWGAQAVQLEIEQGISYTSGSADYAEWLPRISVAEQMDPGDIVGVIGGKISKQTTGVNQLMVISSAPMVLGNVPEAGKEKDYEKVAFMGQVPVKVRGIVNIGDYIIASGNNDGFGIAVGEEKMTAEDYISMVGIAWSESRMTNGVSFINTAVSANNNVLAPRMAQMQRERDELKSQMDAVITYLQSKDPSFSLPQVAPVAKEDRVVEMQDFSLSDLQQYESGYETLKTMVQKNPEFVRGILAHAKTEISKRGIDISRVPKLKSMLADENSLLTEYQNSLTTYADLIAQQKERAVKP
ncbi:MAG: hypothetical protein IPG01_17930 [Chitinophagaceae bacterium]|nr:hypothetical protein [Chitinophagaceae bacterium]